MMRIDIQTTQAVPRLAETMSPQTPYARAMVRHSQYYLALVQKDQQNWTQIDKFYSQIKRAQQSTSQDTMVLDFVWALESYRERRGLWRDQLDSLTQGIHIAKTSQQWKDLIKLLLALSKIYIMQGRLAEGIEACEQSLEINQKHKYPRFEADALRNLANIHVIQGDLDKAISFYQASMDIYRDLGDLLGEGTALNNLGIAYNHKRRWKDALRTYEKAVEIYQKLDSCEMKVFQF